MMKKCPMVVVMMKIKNRRATSGGNKVVLAMNHEGAHYLRLVIFASNTNASHLVPFGVSRAHVSLNPRLKAKY